MPTYAQNKKAHYSYSIDETLEAGLVLEGHEVKSIRKGQVSLEGAYVTIRNQEAWLRKAYIGKYKQATGLDGYDENRERKLLMHKHEIARLIGKSKEKGLTLIPLEIYTSKKRLKLKVGLAKGKKEFDKRESIKKKESKRSIDRALRNKV